MVMQEADLHGSLIKERSREALNALSDHSTRDSPSVDLIRLARLTLTAPCLAHHPWGNANDPLTRRDQRLLKAP
jgi:hypothetical protein